MDSRPEATEYAPFYAGYVSMVPESEVLPVLERQVAEVRELARSVPTERETFRYAPGKWSVREVLGHVCDAERIFAYRTLSIARGETQSLPGFDENLFAAHAGADRVPLAELVEELAAVRGANLLLLRRLDPEAWTRVGIAFGNPVSVRALAFIMAGHLRHHLRVLADRYGVAI